MKFVDTHVHINFKDFLPDLEAVRARWQIAGITKLVHSCTSPDEFVEIQSIVDRFPEVSFAVGLHPLNDDLGEHGWQPQIAEQIHDLAKSDRRVVAIGEMGLDFYKADNHEEQIKAFRAQLAVARALDLPVIIHCRDAAITTREVLESFNAEDLDRPVRGVMHCWAGNPEETQWFLDLGMYISFGGVVTFKNAQILQESAKIVAVDRLLVETDCPFLAPMPNRGKRNEPAYVVKVAEKLAELRNENLSALAAQTTQNAYKLFNLQD